MLPGNVMIVHSIVRLISLIHYKQFVKFNFSLNCIVVLMEMGALNYIVLIMQQKTDVK